MNYDSEGTDVSALIKYGTVSVVLFCVALFVGGIYVLHLFNLV